MLEYLTKHSLSSSLPYPLPQVEFYLYRLVRGSYGIQSITETIHASTVNVTSVATQSTYPGTCRILRVDGTDKYGDFQYLVRYYEKL